MNYGYDSVNCFTLILCGESHLNDILRKPIHEALRQRITIHYNYEGLDDREVSEYILHKLNCAGASRNIISESALGAIHGYSRGNPRLIDNLMTDALTIGAQQECQVIDDYSITVIVKQNSPTETNSTAFDFLVIFCSSCVYSLVPGVRHQIFCLN